LKCGIKLSYHYATVEIDNYIFVLFEQQAKKKAVFLVTN